MMWVLALQVWALALGIGALLGTIGPAAAQVCEVDSLSIERLVSSSGHERLLVWAYDVDGNQVWHVAYLPHETIFALHLDREASRVYIVRDASGVTISVFGCDRRYFASVLPDLGPELEELDFARGEFLPDEEALYLFGTVGAKVQSRSILIDDLRALNATPENKRVDSTLLWERDLDGDDGPRVADSVEMVEFVSADVVRLGTRPGGSVQVPEHFDFGRDDGVIRNQPFSVSFGLAPDDPSNRTVLATDWDGAEVFRRSFGADVVLARSAISSRDAVGMVLLDSSESHGPPRLLRIGLDGQTQEELAFPEGSKILQVVEHQPIMQLSTLSQFTRPVRDAFTTRSGAVITGDPSTGFGNFVDFGTEFAVWSALKQIRYPVGPVLARSPHVVPVAAVGGIGGVANFAYSPSSTGEYVRLSRELIVCPHPETTTPFRSAWPLPDGSGFRVRDAAGLHHVYLVPSSDDDVVYNNRQHGSACSGSVGFTLGPTTHDVDRDGAVALPDVELAAGGWVGTTALNAAELTRADADLDGQLSVADVLYIDRVARGVNLDESATGSPPEIELVESRAVPGGYQVTLQLIPTGPEPIAYQLRLSVDGVAARDVVVSDQLSGTNWSGAVGDEARWLSVRATGGLLRVFLEGDVGPGTVLRLEAGWSARDGVLHLLEPIGFNLDELVKIGDTPPPAPASHTALHSVRPNPFNPATTISFELAEAATIRLVVYDLRGHRVVDLVNGRLGAGQHQETWDGRDATGKRVASGAYWVRLETAERVYTRKMMLVK